MATSARSPFTTSRRVPAAATVMALLAALMWPIPASASDTGTWTELQGDLNGCAGDLGEPTDVTLSGDIDEPGATLTVGCVTELDLNGYNLNVANVVIETGKQLTIEDDSSGGSGTLTADASGEDYAPGIRTFGATLIIESGSVDAIGGNKAAGIGGGYGGSGGSVAISGGTVHANGGNNAAGIGGGGYGRGGSAMISGGTVDATGGDRAAGIGGGEEGASGSVTISGGTIDATGGDEGAGIGGGYEGAGGPVTISGGDVQATGGIDAAGIGGSRDRHGGSVDVGVDAVVTAAGGHTAIGGGDGSSGFGSLTVAGTLRLPAGTMIIPDGIEVIVEDGGRILGGVDDPTMGAEFVDSGNIANEGVIALAASHVTAGSVTVSGHHYEVAFDATGGTSTPDPVVVFAPSFETGIRNLPADPTRADEQVFIGWTDEPDGAGDRITATSTLPGSSEDGTPVEVTAFASWSELTVESGLTDDAVTLTAGESATFTPSVTDRYGEPFASDPTSWTIGGADGLVDASIDPETGLITLASTIAGTYTLELHVPAGGGTVTAPVELHVEPAATAVLHLDVADTTLAQGDQVTIPVTGTDEYANPTGDLNDEITFTSDVATDLIDGNTITFPTASPHTITATHTSGVTATLTFEIAAAAATDDDTPPNEDMAPRDGTPPTTPGPAPTAADGSLARTGANPVGLLIAALLMSLAGTLLLRRSDAPHQGNPTDHTA